MLFDDEHVAQAPMQNCTGLSLLCLLHSLQNAMPFSALSICIALRRANQTSAQTLKPTNGLAQTALTRVSDTMGKEQPFPSRPPHFGVCNDLLVLQVIFR